MLLPNSQPLQNTNPYDFTEQMTTIVRNMTNNTETFYFREDAIIALKDYEKAPNDAKLHRKKALNNICKIYGLTADDVINDHSHLEKIPQIYDALPEHFYKLCQKCPSPQDFMERIVRNLAPEYKNDSVRVAILKKFIKGCGFNCSTYKISAIANLVVQNMSVAEQNEYKKSDKNKKLEIVLKNTNDSLFVPKFINPKVKSSDICNLLYRRIKSWLTNAIAAVAVITMTNEKLTDFINANEDNKLNMLADIISTDSDTSYNSGIIASGLKSLNILSDLTNQIKKIRDNNKTNKYSKLYGIKAPVLLKRIDLTDESRNAILDYLISARILKAASNEDTSNDQPANTETSISIGQMKKAISEQLGNEKYLTDIKKNIVCQLKKAALTKPEDNIDSKDKIIDFDNALSFVCRLQKDTSIQPESYTVTSAIKKDILCQLKKELSIQQVTDMFFYKKMITPIGKKAVSKLNKALVNLQNFNLYLPAVEKEVVFQLKTLICKFLRYAGISKENLDPLYKWLISRNNAYSMDTSGLELLKAAADNAENDDIDFQNIVTKAENDIVNELKKLINIDDKSVREIYKDNKGKALKKQREPFVLLKLCDDLSKGAFRTNGATRLDLYRFAIVFDMTINLKESDILDKKTNIITNLFQDYYCDNMARFLGEEYQDSNYLSTIEREPTGESINFKNFVEVIHLYYLYRKDLNLTPGKAIDNAVKMIDECISTAKKNANKKIVNTTKHRLFPMLCVSCILANI